MGTAPEGRAGDAIAASGWRPTSARRPRGSGSDRVRGDVGPHVVAVAELVVRTVRGDSSPPVHRVDEGSRVGQAAPPGPRRTRVLRRPGLVSLCDRLGEHESPEKGELTGPNPVDRGKYGSKIHLVTEQTGLPLSVGIPPIRSRRGPRRRKPGKLHADKAKRGIRHRIARKGVETSQRLGRHRWSIECTMARLAGCRRLHRRYERKAEHFLAFTSLACTLICYRRLAK